MAPHTLVMAASASVRLQAARAAIAAAGPGQPVLLVAPSRAAADECAAGAALSRGGLFRVTRTSLIELVMRLALPRLARARVTPTSAIGAEAVVARARFDAVQAGALRYFEPVADTPGFPRAAARTLDELQMAGVSPDILEALDAAGSDLATLLARVQRESRTSHTTTRAGLWTEAAAAIADAAAIEPGTSLVLLDVAVTSRIEGQFVGALIARAARATITVPAGDARTQAALAALDLVPAAPDAGADSTALDRLQRYVFSADTPPAGEMDESVSLFSAPGEGREAVEVARRVLAEADRGVPFDEMAILLRAPHTYVGLLEHALARAGVPAWFERGTRRPDPAGRAFLALLACADEQLSARRFAEYLSLAQVPVAALHAPADAAVPPEAWTPPADEVASGLIRDDERAADPPPADEAPLPDERDGSRIVAGTLRAPWRWEELLVEAYVIKGLDRWARRLTGLANEYDVRLRELRDEDADSPRAAAVLRDREELRHLEAFALPIVAVLDGWRADRTWGEWLEAFAALVPRVLRTPARVMRVLAEMAPLGAIGPVSLAEVRDVLSPRLLTLTHEPPRRRQGAVFIGTPASARGRRFRTVFVPGLAERVFPQRLREDALLLDRRRRAVDPLLAVMDTRADDERLQLRLAVGAASERVFLSYPRLELGESRPRVPSFYVLDVVRAVTGAIPRYADLAERAFREGDASLAWPAPGNPSRAIDVFEHDLAVLRPLLTGQRKTSEGRARYLIQLNEALRRSVTERWARWQPKWHTADGLIRVTPDTQAALASQRLTARPYSLTALQRFASCPYQFLLAAIYRLAPLEEPAPLQYLDPLTKGSLFHQIQTEFLRVLQKNGQLPLDEARLPAARGELRWAIAQVAEAARDKLAPAIERVWRDEVEQMTRDLSRWLEQLVADGRTWVPERFELAFGLPPDPQRDAGSTTEPAHVDGRFLLRGSIDLVERKPRTKILRVTDHKTGKNRTTLATIVDGGRVLQPVLYGLALESLTGELVEEGRLSYCTTAGQFSQHAIPLDVLTRRRGVEVLEIIDRAIEHGTLAAKPARDACTFCDFTSVCGHQEERRTLRKPAELLADLDAPAEDAVIADERHLITEALDDTLVVEAAAGTGKTTELVKRIVRLVETGRAARIDQIVAVTFSEKAAGELKLRLREELERARLAADGQGETALRLERAVQRFEEAHVSTIHGFCADLLRERPVEAAVDPAFEVLTEGQAERLFNEAFADWIQKHLDAPSEGVRRSLRRPRSAWSPDDEDDGPLERLRRAGLELLQWRDHPAAWTRPPGFARDREVDALVDALQAFAEMSRAPISRSDLVYRNTEDLRRASADIEVLRARGHTDYDGWEARLCVLAAKARDLLQGKGSGAQYSKTVGRQAILDARAALVAALSAFRDRADADLSALVHADLLECTSGYEARKQKAGALDFLDLLMRARSLVLENDEVRREFQQRFRFLLVDEFQDTDPLQAELLVALASDERGRVRPGALFIVGDPKQSIYRFRRADVGIYHDIRKQLIGDGARPVTLRTSFRSVPSIQRAVNAAFSVHMRFDDASLQADYVELRPDRGDHEGQPAVVALPVPRPYGRRQVTLGNIAASLPEATGEFVRWLIHESGWTVPTAEGGLRRIQAGDICLLFRRFVSFQDDVTEPYVEALESRGVPHLLVGGKAFHDREEVDALRTALTAIEWPGDALSVFATLRGPFFAIGEEALLAYHALGHGFRPYDVPDDLDEALAPVGDALRTLRELNRLRNHRPVADTIGQLIEATRAHAGFVLWRGGEQVLANVLQIVEMARRYEAEGGLSFRGFVDELRTAAGHAPAPEAPIVEEGTDGVRLMTVHKAKGLEFPVVILADIGCKLSRDDASRYLDSRRGLCAIKLGGWTPVDLAEHNAVETERDRAEGVRLAYVAATRARDLLVVPNIGDAPYDRSWVDPLAAGFYPPLADRLSPGHAHGVPAFRGKDTVLERPDMETATAATVRPGAYAMHDPITGEAYTVVWWDPGAIDARGEERRGLRREDLITRDARAEDVAADRARFDAWLAWRGATIERGQRPSVAVLTATEWSKAQPAAPETDPRVTVDAVSPRAGRPSGRRFGTLVHAVLAVAPLDASADEVRALADVQARLMSAPAPEAAAAAALATDVLAHPQLETARRAQAAGRPCLREVPLSLVRDGILIDGQADLAFEDEDGWVVVDFKTDAEIGPVGEQAYRRQVALYADAITHATAKPARGVLLRV